jgi:hypothetical protein
MFDGILATVEHNITDIPSVGTDDRILGHDVTENFRNRLAPLMLDSLIAQLGKLNREIIDKCFLLRARIDQFRTSPTSLKATELNQEIAAIKKIGESYVTRSRMKARRS